MKSLALLFKIVAAIYIFSVLTACGGGGGGSSSDTGDGFTISVSSLKFSASQNGTIPSNQNIQVNYTHPEVAFVGAAYPPGVTPVSWLDVKEPVGSGSSLSFPFTINSTALSPGNYSTIIALGIARSDGSIIAHKNVSVTYTVFTASLSSTVINFTTNSTTLSAPQNLTLISNANDIEWTSSISYTNGASGWLSLSSSDLTAPANITLNAIDMPAGVYRANISFNVGEAETSIPVTLTVHDIGVNFVSPYVATTNIGGDVIIRGHGFTSITNPEVKFGTMSASMINVISDSEIRATHPALPKGNYLVTVKNATKSLSSKAELVVVDSKSYSYTTILRDAWTNAASIYGLSNKRLIYDREREALYITDRNYRRIERYLFNGVGWDVDSIISLTSPATALSPDGKELLSASHQSMVHIDPITWSITDTVSSVPVLGDRTFETRMDIANNGVVIGNANVQSTSYLMYKYDVLLKEYFLLAVPDEIKSFTNINRHFFAPTDYSKIFLASQQGGRFYSYNSSDGSLEPGNSAVTSVLDFTTNRTGSRIALKTAFSTPAIVYDESLSQLGSLPPSSAFVMSPDGKKVFNYINSSSMIHTYDLTSPDGNGGFNEIGNGVSVLDSMGSGHQIGMTISPDAQTLFLAGYDKLIIMSAP